MVTARQLLHHDFILLNRYIAQRRADFYFGPQLYFWHGEKVDFGAVGFTSI